MQPYTSVERRCTDSWRDGDRPEASRVNGPWANAHRWLSVAPFGRIAMSWRPVAAPAAALSRPSVAWKRSDVRSVIAILLLAAVVTANDLLLSARLGLLANPVLSDGLAYLIQTEVALSDIERFNAGTVVQQGLTVALSPASTLMFHAVPVTRLYAEHAPIWSMLIALQYQILGAGEWQAHTVRFWAAALLLLLMFVLVRRQSTTAFAWVAVLLTSTLPVVSTSVRSATYEFFVSKRVNFGQEWFLADLRPDFSFSVAVLFTTVAFFEWRARPSFWTALLLGGAFGIAALVKPTVLSALLLALGALTVFAWCRRRQHPLPPFWQFVAAATVGFVCLVPWIVAGGAMRTVTYVITNSTLLAGIWAGTGMSTGVDPLYYWRPFDEMMGSEAWVVFGLGLAALAFRWWRREPALYETTGFVVIGLVLAAYLSVTPSKSWPVAPVIYLPLWAAAWCALAPVAMRALERMRLNPNVLVAGAGLYCALLVAGSWYAYARWPAYGRDTGPTNRRTTTELAGELNRLLAPGEQLLSMEMWGYPGVFRLGHPDRWIYLYTSHNMFFESQDGKPPDALADEVLGRSDAVKVALLTDLTSVSDMPHVNTTPVARPYFDAFLQRVKARESPFVVARTYPITADPFTNLSANEDGKRAPSLLLFVREDWRSLDDLGFTGPRDGIQYGRGWQNPEAASGERFRWGGDDVELILSPTGKRQLSLDLELAPDLEGTSSTLTVVGDDGSVRRLLMPAGRARVSIEVPGSPDTKRGVRLRVEQQDGSSVASDTPILRIFDASWTDSPSAVTAHDDADLR